MRCFAVRKSSALLRCELFYVVTCALKPERLAKVTLVSNVEPIVRY